MGHPFSPVTYIHSRRGDAAMSATGGSSFCQPGDRTISGTDRSELYNFLHRYVELSTPALSWHWRITPRSLSRSESTLLAGSQPLYLFTGHSPTSHTGGLMFSMEILPSKSRTNAAHLWIKFGTHWCVDWTPRPVRLKCRPRVIVGSRFPQERYGIIMCQDPSSTI